MSRDGILHKNLKKVHSKYNTPYIGIIFIMVIDIILQISLYHKDGIEVFGYFSTIGSLALIICYLFTCIGAFVYFRKNESRNILNTFIPLVSIFALAYVLYSNIYPVPVFPTNLCIYIVLFWIAVGFMLSCWFRRYNIRHMDSEIEQVSDITIMH